MPNKKNKHALALTPLVVVASLMTSTPIASVTVMERIANVRSLSAVGCVVPTVKLDLRLHNADQGHEKDVHKGRVARYRYQCGE
jgi:hypothetical protein